ncbi:flagellar hook-associated protein FlgK [Hyphococcus sp. DH-69]|uniref:flagellar hook-associated protein FlgK n=1 Tax=Hyphococcus formosus TaxID=3143534 RepID=UPI00398B615F
MTISQALYNASSGLTAASKRVSVTSNNIANALTPGYARRTVHLAEQTTGGEGAGVSVAGISRATNPALTYERRIVDGELAYFSANAGAMTRVSDLLGGVEDPTSLFQKYNNFEASLRNLAETPDSAALQQKVVSTAQELTRALNKTAEGYQQIRADADMEISNRVKSVNDALQTIEDLNDSISRGLATGKDVNALLDQRQQLVDLVNENIPVKEIQREYGKVDLMTTEGVFLLAGSAKTIEFTPSPVVTADLTYNNGAGTLSGLTIDGNDITPGGPSGQSPRDGAVAGLFNVRDVTVPEMALALDALAYDIASRLSDPAVDPTLNPGDPGIFTDAGANADVANLNGLAGRISVNALVDSSQGGSPSRIRDGIGSVVPQAAGTDAFVRSLLSALADNRPQHAALQTAGDLTAAESFSHMTSLAAGARVDASSKEATSATLATSLSEAEQLESGVDTDRELQDLLVIEQAYAANARVLETIDQMMRRLMEI